MAGVAENCSCIPLETRCFSSGSDASGCLRVLLLATTEVQSVVSNFKVTSAAARSRSSCESLAPPRLTPSRSSLTATGLRVPSPHGENKPLQAHQQHIILWGPGFLSVHAQLTYTGRKATVVVVSEGPPDPWLVDKEWLTSRLPRSVRALLSGMVSVKFHARRGRMSWEVGSLKVPSRRRSDLGFSGGKPAACSQARLRQEDEGRPDASALSKPGMDIVTPPVRLRQ